MAAAGGVLYEQFGPLIDLIKANPDVFLPIVGSVKALIQGLSAIRDLVGLVGQAFAQLQEIGNEIFKGLQSRLEPIISLLSRIPGLGGGGPETEAGTPVETRQEGGPAIAGTPYLVGEQGPEIFVPGETGNVVPIGTPVSAGPVTGPGPGTAAGGAGIQVSVVIQVVAGELDDIKEAIKSAIDELSIDEFRIEAGLPGAA